MIDRLETVLAQLPEPEPAPLLRAGVMARIAREQDTASTAPVVGSAPGRLSEALACLALVAGLTIVVGLSLEGWIVTGALPDLTSPRGGLGRSTLLLIDARALLLLSVAVWLFARGLFAPIVSRRSQRTARSG